ncbi:hypothetical protein [Curtobacterium flaccumfaciens]|uniref:hypothetical protein n=1 Tax=Curtobacterium flaccumfaciens TaxID=2035 RepID=UPI001BDE7A5F|nr:hypothetical protein [Curtobacterium flaccumfaciens]MBT1633756.1 hypothetical protein [Curtobacterium flaccumfaciens pv. oortii]MCX2845560.1 hypothetical protein [Curtobacterium flaccumfaciens pv. oortii]
MGDHKAATKAGDALASVQRYAKAIVALVGSVLTAGVFTLPDEVQPWVGLGMAVLTTVGTYVVPNAKPAADETTAGYPDALKTEPGDALG